MGSGNRRLVAEVLGGVLLVVFAGWAGYAIGQGGAGGPGPSTPDGDRPSDPGPVDRPADPRAVESPPGDGTPQEGAGPAAGAPEAARPSGLAPDEEFPALDVEVVDSTGAPYGFAEVYLLPEGAPGVDELALAPHAECDDRGRCRVQVPSPGRYDVGAVSGIAHVLVPSVAVPAPETLRLALPPMGLVRFDDGREPPENPVYVGTAAGARQAMFPGRDQRLRSERIAALRDPNGTLVARAAVGVELEGYVQNSSVLLDPPRFTAPATVSLVRGTNVQAHLRFAPPERSWPVPVSIEVHFDWGEDARTPFSGVDYSFDLPANTPLSEHPERHITPGALVLARRGSVRWSGPDILPGEAAWDLDRGPDVEVVLQVNESSEGLTRRPPTARVSDPERLSREAPVLWMIRPTGGSDLDWSDAAAAVGVPVDLDRKAQWVFATAGASGIAGPRAVDARQPETPLALRRGGWLLVLPDRVSDGGSPRLRRADGAPLFVINGEGDAILTLAAVLHAGQRLGPFEPGDLALELDTPGGLRQPLRVRVEAGRYTALPLTSCPAK